ncbi:Peptidoglycan/xylan/chitin deacetylase, PgdA/CDA1 family [Saccharicrinis carchari]|uniref:Peptidoglycan/xylan/chitin deacetylase, PgdA/CDA1 family n=1 Tax=Saccharicrinis carchari TaxID=1168039 RepID=A0A521CN95_SACCC|nr:polysaccharide deacetylase family protein [Saccharicrinis carchari]SMO60140.1 Peptidoglycan/xylan/chitin deacetylase, PgdA/CDA1 family [Saccharicrinis carchari]
MVRPPLFAKYLLSQLTWRYQHTGNEVFVSFDDGPIPEITPWVLNEADRWGAKLTFFCVGENVHRYPDIFDEIIKRGHKVGNHTYNHLSAWRTDRVKYFDNVRKASSLIESTLFRPPHGQLYPWYVAKLKQSFDKIVMWDVLSKDYDSRLTGSRVFDNVKNYIRPGSIVVFHDSLKAEKNMKYAFPKTLEMIAQKKWTTRVIK